jgi:hypothetical protein
MRLLCPINQSFHTSSGEKFKKNNTYVSRAFSRRAKILNRRHRHKHQTMAEEKEADDDSINTFLEGLSVIAEHEPPIDDSSTSNDEEEKDDALNQIERATDNNNPTTPTPIAPTTPSPSRRPATTSRNSSSTTKKRLAQCRKGARIKVTRNNLMHCLLLDAQKEALAGFGNHRNFYGTVLSGSGRQGYMILFDDLPAGNQQVTIRRRNIMTVVQGNEEEHEYDHRSAVPNACAEINRGRKEDPMKASAKLFCGMEKDIIATATTYHTRSRPVALRKCTRSSIYLHLKTTLEILITKKSIAPRFLTFCMITYR